MSEQIVVEEISEEQELELRRQADGYRVQWDNGLLYAALCRQDVKNYVTSKTGAFDTEIVNTKNQVAKFDFSAEKKTEKAKKFDEFASLMEKLEGIRGQRKAIAKDARKQKARVTKIGSIAKASSQELLAKEVEILKSLGHEFKAEMPAFTLPKVEKT